VSNLVLIVCFTSLVFIFLKDGFLFEIILLLVIPQCRALIVSGCLGE